MLNELVDFFSSSLVDVIAVVDDCDDGSDDDDG